MPSVLLVSGSKFIFPNVVPLGVSPLKYNSDKVGNLKPVLNSLWNFRFSDNK